MALEKIGNLKKVGLCLCSQLVQRHYDRQAVVPDHLARERPSFVHLRHRFRKVYHIFIFV